MNISLKGKRALVCGGSKGLGWASAKEIAALGCTVTLLSRNEELLGQKSRELQQVSPDDHSYIVGDLSDIESVKTAIKKILIKPFHILINNAGGPAPGLLLDANSKAFVDAFILHLIANHELSNLLIPGMKKEGYGRIINITSTTIRQPIHGLGVSNTIRGSVASWSKTLSNELAPYGITVNNVMPGSTKTERLDSLIDNIAKNNNLPREQVIKNMEGEIPFGRFAEPQEFGAVVAFLATPAASYITGTNIPVDGGKIRSI